MHPHAASPTKRPRHRLATATMSLALVVLAACGGDSDEASERGDGATEAAASASGSSSSTSSETSGATSGGAADTTEDRGCVEGDGSAGFDEQVEPEHSELWDISYHDTYKVLTVPNTEFPERDDLHYVLVQCGAPEPDLDGELADAPVFEVPIERTATNHNNGLAMLELIGATDTIVGMSDEMLSYPDDPWYSEVVETADDPQVIATSGDGVEYEATLGVEPDLLVMAGYGPGYTNVADEVERGLPAVMVANRLESTPLGSAEWMKFLSAFYGAEAEANDAFGDIADAYTKVAETAEGAAGDDNQAAYLCIDPDVGCEFTYAHGADTLNGRILDTLGVSNPFAEGNDAGNGMNFDFEQSLARAAETDFLIVYDRLSTVEDLIAGDDRYSNLTALAEGDYIAQREDAYAYCRANSYVRVDVLIHDYAIGMNPELFPGEEGRCFAAPS